MRGPGAWDYRVYGVRLRSSLALPCVPLRAQVTPDVRLRAGNLTRFARALDDLRRRRPSSWFEQRQLPDRQTYLRWQRLFEFLISQDGRTIHYRRLDRSTSESFGAYLLGHVLSFSLLALGVDPLHGTVVAVDDGAVAFVGDCGYGKSTVGAALLARGFPMVTDDLIALEQSSAGWLVQPGVPRIKLFPSIAHPLLGTVSGARLNHRTRKLILPLNASQVADRPLPLKMMYVLSEPSQCERAAPDVARCSGPEAFLEVIRAAFNLTVTEKTRLANQFALATRLVAEVPVQRLSYARTLAALPAVCDAVLEDLGRQ